jgi:hypothetical protein
MSGIPAVFFVVMPGLDPGIHQNKDAFEQGWMAGSSPRLSGLGFSIDLGSSAADLG